MNGNTRSYITQGIKVRIVLKADQRSGKLTEGIVKDILTNSPTHPHGIKRSATYEWRSRTCQRDYLTTLFTNLL